MRAAGTPKPPSEMTTTGNLCAISRVLSDERPSTTMTSAGLALKIEVKHPSIRCSALRTGTITVTGSISTSTRSLLLGPHIVSFPQSHPKLCPDRKTAAHANRTRVCLPMPGVEFPLSLGRIVLVRSIRKKEEILLQALAGKPAFYLRV